MSAASPAAPDVMRVAIIGCGLVGTRRAAALTDSTLTVACDREPDIAGRLAGKHAGCRTEVDPFVAASAGDIDLVIVATTHDQLAPIARVAALAGKHVLIEKPGARTASELAPVAEAAEKTGIIAKVGFNHRFHPAIRQALDLAPSLGPLLFVRGRYGHGGRIDYEKEWRLDPNVSGGGELLDQGMHLIDLSRAFLGDFVEVRAHLPTYFWQAPVEDNAFLCLLTAQGQAAWLHAGWTEWKNIFCLEVFCRDGKLQIDGLGGSYGTERLTQHKMKPSLGPPETTCWEYPGDDSSWGAEYRHMLECIRHRRQPSGSIADAMAALAIVDRAYSSARP